LRKPFFLFLFYFYFYFRSYSLIHRQAPTKTIPAGMAPSLAREPSVRIKKALEALPVDEPQPPAAPSRCVSLSILATPPQILRTRLQSSSEYFTPAFYDTLALFLHKHGIRYHSICLLGRGVTPDEAQRCPAVVVTVHGGAATVEHVRRLFVADEALMRAVPEEVKVVEFMGNCCLTD
jgi:hypothetical protein